ncbi:MAG: M6 family metalloprotease domain-containing protein [Paludibacteraceae bacterium]|nr:M6 family metalloprotease domain-containing protein [Paludibacteraceae bacterium]MBR1481261.1 M6 family metalloprotease domain-containing protein [Paludibacteraceae bacterium]
MRRLSAIVGALLLCVGLMAVPASPQPRRVVQPDGTVVELYLHGDEYTHYVTDAAGRILRLSNGYYIPTGEQHTSRAPLAHRARRAKVSRPYRDIGHINIAPRGLFILVNFSDVQFRPENSPEDMDLMLNGDDYTYNGAIGSVRRYFIDQSNGTYNPQFDVVGPVTLAHEYAYYGENEDTDDANDRYIADFAMDACTAAEALGVDFSLYDNDDDGVIDFVYFIYAGKGEANGGDDYTIWPASWDIESALTGDSHQSAYYVDYTEDPETGEITVVDENLPQYGGVTLGAFAYSAELNSRDRRDGIGTLCHEFSHVLGLPDYYDIYYGANRRNRLTPGQWSLMDHGSYNGNGNLPPNWSAHDKYYVGWATPTLLCTTQDVTLPADGQTYGYLTSDGTAASPTDTREVWYLENRQQTGWDAGLPGHGMLITKVTYDPEVWDANEPNSVEGVILYDVLVADGTHTDGDSGDPWPGTTGRTTFSDVAGYPLSDIAEVSGLITFHVEAPEEPTSLETLTAGRDILGRYDLLGNRLPATALRQTGLYIVQTTQRTYKIQVR